MKSKIDAALITVNALAVAILPILVNSGRCPSDIAAAIGAGLGVLIGGYHAGGYVASATPAAPEVSGKPVAQDTQPS